MQETVTSGKRYLRNSVLRLSEVTLHVPVLQCEVQNVNVGLFLRLQFFWLKLFGLENEFSWRGIWKDLWNENSKMFRINYSCGSTLFERKISLMVKVVNKLSESIRKKIVATSLWEMIIRYSRLLGHNIWSRRLSVADKFVVGAVWNAEGTKRAVKCELRTANKNRQVNFSTMWSWILPTLRKSTSWWILEVEAQVDNFLNINAQQPLLC